MKIEHISTPPGGHDSHGHLCNESCTQSPLAGESEFKALAAAAAAAEKATKDAAKIRSALAERHNQFVDLCDAVKHAHKVVKCGQAQLSEAEGDYRRSIGTLESGVGNYEGVFRSSWDFARQIATEQVGLTLLREAVGKLPPRLTEARKNLRDFIKAHSVPRELWPTELAEGDTPDAE